MNPEGLAAAREIVLSDLRRAGVAFPEALTLSNYKLLDITLRKALHAYADKTGGRFVKRDKRSYSPQTHKLAEMKVGDVVTFYPQPFQSLRGRMKSARELMKNEDAQWTLRMDGNDIVCERLDDGAPLRKVSKSEKVQELASLKPGESIISKTILSVRSKGQLSSNNKIMARRVLNDEKADWTVKQTNKGVRLTRLQ